MAAPMKPPQPQNPSNTPSDGVKGGVPSPTIQQRQSGLPAFVLDYGLTSLFD